MKFRTLLAATAGATAVLFTAAGPTAGAGSLQLATSLETAAWVDAYETGGRINSRGDAVLNGALSCPAGSVYTLKVQAEQRTGAPVIGVGAKTGKCTGSETAWTVTADAPRRFQPGEAFVSAELIVCDQSTCETLGARAYTQLTR